MKDFTITHIGDTALSLPMPFKYIPAKGKTFMFQADVGLNVVSKGNLIPITFNRDFWICVYLTTQEFWVEGVKEISSKDLKYYPSFHKGKIRPVENVSWDDIQIFNKGLNYLLKNRRIIVNDNPQIISQFGLPSETQWSYAAAADQNTSYAGSDRLDDVGWYVKNSNGQTMPVGLKQPNAWGLYDLNGNVWEWCADNYNPKASEIPINGTPNLKKAKSKVIRGGSFLNGDMVQTHRFSGLDCDPQLSSSSIGFRLIFSTYDEKML
ncbi:MAG TPA: formylglycine-generating enzyme family protein [Leadbetterella sp.]|nr:formylglycine-generating enzyme family protein [Leadbetterella sp.]